MGKIYTKTGDHGDTGYIGGRVPKSSAMIELVGDLDELNAQLGLAVSCLVAKGKLGRLRSTLLRVQHELFALGAVVADPGSQLGSGTELHHMIEALENEIDAWEIELPVLQNFILPGGGVAGANLHVARTVCRRAERSCVRLGDSLKTSKQKHEVYLENVNATQRYLNRLSDWLFVLARTVNLLQEQPEQVWVRQ